MILTGRQRKLMYLVVVVFMLGFAGGLIHWSQWSKNQYRAMTSRTIETNNIIGQRLNDIGQQVTTARSNYITKEELKQGTDSTVNTLKKELVGPIRSLERTTKILTTRIEQLAMPVRDTVVMKEGKEVKGWTFSYQSEYVPKMHGLLLGDSVYLDYQLKGGFDMEYHWKKTGLFKPKELSLMITSKDPAVTIDRVQNFQIVAPVPMYKRPGTAAGAGFIAGLIVGGLIEIPVFK